MDSIIKLHNQIYKGANNKSSVFDLETPSNWNGKLIIFIHGYMGYKDWGCWNLVQSFFLEQGFGFLKYNGTHNGGTVDNPIDFDDLESFSKNVYTNEVKDIEVIIELAKSQFETMPELLLIGHSRGGGIALLQSLNENVSKISTWAAIASIKDRFPEGEELAEWEKNGVRYRKNGRTNQNMPHGIVQYHDYVANTERLDIEAYCKKSKVPSLIIHGEQDDSINISDGERIAGWLGTDLHRIKDTQHTFDSSQPWEKDAMPVALAEVCQLTLDFFKQS